MENREQYKRLIMFFASALILLVQVVIFYYIWHRYYNYRSVIGALYWRRGNWALMGVYAFINFFFSKIFGAYKVGHLHDRFQISRKTPTANQRQLHVSHAIAA